MDIMINVLQGTLFISANRKLQTETYMVVVPGCGRFSRSVS